MKVKGSIQSPHPDALAVAVLRLDSDLVEWGRG
jgi:hypothetical protein